MLFLAMISFDRITNENTGVAAMIDGGQSISLDTRDAVTFVGRVEKAFQPLFEILQRTWGEVFGAKQRGGPRHMWTCRWWIPILWSTDQRESQLEQ